MDIKNKIYCWWLNEEDMSDNRKRSLDNLISVSGCEVIFITKDSLDSFILKDYPLHEGYQYLSEIQKGDYLKCYFMHHYGGGYSDIKKTLGPWSSFFDDLRIDKNIYAIGYSEADPGHVARLENCTLNPKNSKYCLEFTTDSDGNNWSSEHLKNNWNLLIGNGAFICKKNTPFTLDWWLGLNEKMDGYLELIKDNPSSWPRDSREHINPKTNLPSKYPISWAVLNGNIFHPLTLKYKNNIKRNLHYPVVTNYQ